MKRVMFLGLMSFVIFAGCGRQRSRPVTTFGEFNARIRSEISVVRFYSQVPKQDVYEYSLMKKLETFTRDLQAGYIHKNKKLIDVFDVDISRSRVMDSLSYSYGITTSPTFVFFSNGEKVGELPVKDPANFSLSKINEYIRYYFKDKLDEKTQKIDEEYEKLIAYERDVRKEREKQKNRSYYKNYYKWLYPQKKEVHTKIEQVGNGK